MNKFLNRFLNCFCAHIPLCFVSSSSSSIQVSESVSEMLLFSHPETHIKKISQWFLLSRRCSYERDNLVFTILLLQERCHLK